MTIGTSAIRGRQRDLAEGRRAIIRRDGQATHPDELDPEHRTRSRVVGDELLDDPGQHAWIGHSDRRRCHHHAPGQQPREHALDASRDTAQDALVDVVEWQSNELGDQEAGIAAADLQRAYRPQSHRLTGRRDDERGRHIERHFDGRRQHEERRDRTSRIRTAPVVATGAQTIGNQPRRAHHNLLILSARHLACRADRKRPSVDEMVGRDGVAHDDQHRSRYYRISRPRVGGLATSRAYRPSRPVRRRSRRRSRRRARPDGSGPGAPGAVTPRSLQGPSRYR